MIEEILKKVKHKDTVKATTTLQFKMDLIEILRKNLTGDILEIGTSSGFTTAILAAIAFEKGYEVHTFDNSIRCIEAAKNFIEGAGLFNCHYYVKDAYKDKWDVNKMGCVFIDCVHRASNFLSDLKNTEEIIDCDSIVVAHDYGLVLPDGDGIKRVFEGNLKYEIIRFMGEQDDWNSLGSGSVVDWEGVQVKINKN